MIIKNSLIIIGIFLIPALIVGQPEGNWIKTNGPYGCKWVYDLEISPTNRNHIFIATNRGIYKTTDGGVKWKELVNGINTNEKYEDIEIDPVNSQIIYSISLYSFYKSYDGGNTWVKIPVIPQGSEQNSLALDYVNTQILYLGRNKYHFDGTRSYNTPEILKSTDGGNTWKIIFSSDKETFSILNITISPFDNNTLFVGTWGTLESNGEGILVSYDGGENWEVFLSGYPLEGRAVQGFTVDPVDPNIFYFGTNVISNPQTPTGVCYKSSDGGKTWNELVGIDKGGMVRRILIDPSDNETIFICGDRLFFRSNNGGKNLIYGPESFYAAGVFMPNVGDYEADFSQNEPIIYAGGYGVYKSIDGGETFKLIIDGIESEITRTIKIDPYRPERAYTFTYTGYGNSFTHDSGITWQLPQKAIFNNYGMLMDIDLTNSDIIYGTCTWGLWRSYDSGFNWEWINSAFQNSHVHGLAIDPFDGNTIYVGVGRDYTNPIDHGLFRTTNGGARWIKINEGFSFDVHVSEIKIDPINPKNVYVATRGHQVMGSYDKPTVEGRGIFKSIDGGDHWFQINNGLTNPSISSIVIDPTNPNILYAGATSEFYLEHLNIQGGVFKSSNGGESWFAINNGLTLPQYPDMRLNVHCLSICAARPEVVYAAIMDASYERLRGAVFKTTDGGANWELFSEGLKREGSDLIQAIEFIDIDPTGNILYCATNAGVVYKLENVQLTDTLPPVIIAGPTQLTESQTSLRLRWHTNEKSTSIVQYGKSSDYQHTISQSELTIHHDVILNDLDNSESWHFRVGSVDSLGNGPRWSRDLSINFSTDYTSPTLSSTTQLIDSENNGPFKIFTRAYDNVGIKAVRLNYSTNNSKSFIELEMVSTGENEFTAEIPSQPTFGFVDYFIVAYDLSGNIVKDPSFAPNETFTFRILDPIKPITSYVYFASFDGPSVRRLNLNNNSIEDIHYNYGQYFSWLGSINSSIDNSILVRTCYNTAGIIDAATADVTGIIDVEVCDSSSLNCLGRTAISVDNKYAYSIKYCHEIPNRISVINLENHIYEGDITDEKNFNYLVDLEISKDGKFLYALDANGNDSKIIVIDLNSRTASDIINLYWNARGLAISSDERYLFTLSGVLGKSFLFKISLSTNTILDSVEVSPVAHHNMDNLVINRKDNTVFITSVSDSKERIIEVSVDPFEVCKSHLVNIGNTGTVQDFILTGDDKTLIFPINGLYNAYRLDILTNEFMVINNLGINSGELAYVEVISDKSVNVEDDEEFSKVPNVSKLYNAYPNPFNSSTNIKIYLHVKSEIKVEIFSVHGQKIKTLAKGLYPIGMHTFQWDGNNDKGNKCSSGIYFINMKYKNIAASNKLILLK